MTKEMERTKSQEKSQYVHAPATASASFGGKGSGHRSISTALRVAVVVPTYRRPERLAHLLEALEAEITDCHAHWRAGIALCVIVVDNDAELQQGAAVVRRMAPSMNCEVQVHIEPATGVSVVRNRLVAAAQSWRAELIQMIDDDEYPEAGWLRRMVECAGVYRADIVSGPVRADFASTPPPWVVEHFQYSDRPHETGTFPAVQRTSNVLFRASSLRNEALFTNDEWFDLSLGRAGGEDSHLIERMVNAGAVHVWCEEAAVNEHISAERLEPRYLRERAWRYGNCGMVYRKLLHPGVGWSVVRVGKTAFLFARWLLLSYRYLMPGQRELHHLELCTVRGRVSAHLGNVKGQYGA